MWNLGLLDQSCNKLNGRIAIAARTGPLRRQDCLSSRKVLLRGNLIIRSTLVLTWPELGKLDWVLDLLLAPASIDVLRRPMLVRATCCGVLTKSKVKKDELTSHSSKQYPSATRKRLAECL